MSLTKPGNERSRPRKSRIGVAVIVMTLAVSHILIVQTPASAAHEIRVPTGTLTDFSVLAHSKITNTGTSTFADGVGVWPGNEVVGISEGDVASGGIHLGDEVAEKAQFDFLVAYDYAAAQTPTVIPAELGGQTLKAGVYGPEGGGTALSLGTTLTLDADGDKNAIFIIQTEGAFGSTADTGGIALIDGAQACNVFFQVAGAVTLGAGSSFAGTLLSQGAITVGDKVVDFDGRAFTGSGDMTLSNNVFSEPTCDGTTVTPTHGLTTTEAGTADTFTVVLDSQPSAEVTIGVSSSDETEGTVSPASLTFTTGDWNVAQTVTVTGVNDSVDDGDIGYTVVLAPATGGGLSGTDPADVEVTNSDNDIVTVSPTSGLVTTEAGGVDTFTVVLDSQPSAEVTIGVSSSDETEGTVSPASLTFTTGDWNVAQTVTVTGVNDSVDDGDIGYLVVLAAATGGDYEGIDPDDVSVANSDDDTVGVTVTPTATPLVTTEAGTADTFTVVLDSQPSAEVTIGVSSSDTTEGTVSPASLTFPIGDWNVAQTVTVSGVDDSVDDGDIGYLVVLAAATGGDYEGIDPDDVSVANSDDDTVGVTVTPTATPLVTTEAGTADTFTVVLDSQPSADVTIGVSSSDTTEGTASTPSLVFSTQNWATSQTVTVTGVDDSVDDGDIAYSVVLAASTGPGGYDEFDPDDVSVSNTDDDTVGITVSPTSGLVTTEAGGVDTFTVVLDSQPSAEVTIGVSSSDTTEGTVSPASLTFPIGDWNVAQTVTVTGVDDSVDDGDIAYSVVLAASTGPGGYDEFDPDDVSVSNTDDDTVGVTVTPTATPLVTTEAGGTATFTVVLDSQPSADVTIGVSSSDTTEGTASTPSLVFSTQNWSTAQTVTVTGADDHVGDGIVVYSVVLGVATGGDYDGLDPADVAVSNTDDDTVGVTVTPTATPLVTTEAGGMATFTVVLDSQSSADVTIGVSSSDTTEGTVDTALLTFTTGNWATSQAVTVTGVDDSVDDGDVAYSVVLAAATGGDYAGIDPDDVAVVNTDACTHDFSDVDGSNIFEDGICWLADQSITLGCNPPFNTEFCPEDPVTRGQMAAFLVRAFGYTDDGGGDLFTDDDGSIFEAAIDRLRTAGVTRGCNPPFNTEFCPEDPVSREQMAAFLSRAFKG